MEYFKVTVCRVFALLTKMDMLHSVGLYVQYITVCQFCPACALLYSDKEVGHLEPRATDKRAALIRTKTVVQCALLCRRSVKCRLVYGILCNMLCSVRRTMYITFMFTMCAKNCIPKKTESSWAMCNTEIM